MNLDLRYLGRSGAVETASGLSLRLSPNLARPKVFYDAELASPVRFREAISALHEVVVGDLRFHKKDKSGYRAFLKERADEERRLREIVTDRARREAAAERAAPKATEASRSKIGEPEKVELGLKFKAMHLAYTAAFHAWGQEIWLTELVRHVVAFDPVVTVAPDCVFFEAFAKDESSYGCLFVDRGAFRGEGAAGLGTTNVDYSPALFDHFQGLRSYRNTRLQVDPQGFEVQVQGGADLREEKIDLPATWLRGFGQLQAAMALPSRVVTIPVEALYSVLAFLRRHREKGGPRSLRFQLVPGRVPVLVLDPWGVFVVCHGAPVWQGEAEEVKVWGRRRLLTLARLLPLAEKIEVRLLGSGLPSVWSVSMGELRYVLALSGWTANDWTSGAALEGLGKHKAASAALVERAAQSLERLKSASLAAMVSSVGAPEPEVVGALHTLAKQGQAVYDFARETYRWRPVMPVALSEAALGPEPDEVVNGKVLYFEDQVKLGKPEKVDAGHFRYTATAHGTPCEAVFDLDGGLSKARCDCSHHYRFKLRRGPCRHLLALKLSVQFELAERRRGAV